MTSNSSVEAIFVKFESIRSGGVGINSKKIVFVHRYFGRYYYYYQIV